MIDITLPTIHQAAARGASVADLAASIGAGLAKAAVAGRWTGN